MPIDNVGQKNRHQTQPDADPDAAGQLLGHRPAGGVGIAETAVEHEVLDIVEQLLEKRFVQTVLFRRELILFLGIVRIQHEQDRVAGHEVTYGEHDDDDAEEDRDHPEDALENVLDHPCLSSFPECAGRPRDRREYAARGACSARNRLPGTADGTLRCAADQASSQSNSQVMRVLAMVRRLKISLL